MDPHLSFDPAIAAPRRASSPGTKEKIAARIASRLRTCSTHHLMLASALVLGLAIMMPLLATPAAAQALCLDGEIWSEAEGQCVALAAAQPDEETQPTEIPAPAEPSIAEEAAQATEVPAPTDPSAVEEAARLDKETQLTEPPAPDEPGAAPTDDGDLRVGQAPVGLGLFSNGCPNGFDVRTADFDTLYAACSSFLAGVQWSLTVDGQGFGSATSPEGPYPAQFTDVPPGDFALSQSVPAGYSGPATVVCYEANHQDTSQTRYSFNDGGSFVLPGVQPGSYWYCHSFLVANPNNEITVYVFGCPDSYDLYSKSPEQLKADCTGQFEGTEFSLSHPTAGISLAMTSSFSTASFVGIPAGQVTLKEAMPNGYGVPVVFCQVRGPDGQTTEQYDRFNVSNNASIQLGMDDFEFVGCDFFQAPGGQPVLDTAGPQDQGFPALDTGAANLDIAPGSSAVSIYALACPEGFDAFTPDTTLYETCRQVQADLWFVLTVNNNTSGATTTGPEGFAYLPDVPAGDFVVTEALPLGFGPPIVYCRIVDRLSGEITREDQRHDASPNGSIVVPGVQADQAVYCTWFNVPTDATGALDVIAWNCPAGYDLSTKGPGELIGDCGEKLGGIAFQLHHPIDGISTQMTAGLRSTAYFRNVAPGQVTLMEFMPDGYGVPVVFCEARGPDGQTVDGYDRYNVSNSASVQLGMDALDRFRCDFFQVNTFVPGAGPDLPVAPASGWIPRPVVLRLAARSFPH